MIYYVLNRGIKNYENHYISTLSIKIILISVYKNRVDGNSAETYRIHPMNVESEKRLDLNYL